METVTLPFPTARSAATRASRPDGEGSVQVELDPSLGV